MNWLYLAINLGSLIPTLLFSFHPRLKFYKRFPFAIPAIVVVALLFIIWDMYYTLLGVWGFNQAYISGIYVINLPIEEVLFFICIPFACLYTYHCFSILFPKDYFKPLEKKITIALLIFLLAFGVINFPNLYTSVVFIALSIVLFVLQFVFKVNWLSRFYFTYLILIIPFSIVNGILTGTGLPNPVVWYNEKEIIGLRLGTIPFEDIFYGMLLLICSTAFYEYIGVSQSSTCRLKTVKHF